MGIGDVNASSFEAYEGIRILLPGAIVVTLYAYVVATWAPSLASPSANTFGAIVAALLIGLFLLFVDFPARSAVYKSRELPDPELRSWDIDATPYGGDGGGPS